MVPSQNRISEEGRVTALRPLLMDLLVYLADHAGRVVTKDELSEKVWGAKFVSDSALARAMTGLRQALGDAVESPRYVETIPKRGYRLVAEVERETVAAPNSIAVLPFQDLSKSRDQEYFCDGLAEELINSLTQMSGLRVVARTSAFAFKHKALDAREIGRKLNAGALVEGSLQCSGQRLRVTVQLVDAKDGYHVWSQRFDGRMGDIFALEDEIARGVAEKLRVRLGAAEAVRPAAADPEAYRLCLQGRHAYMKMTAAAMEQAIQCYRKALEREPGCARAWAGLADAYWDGAEMGLLNGPDDLREGRRAALRAVELDPNLAEAHAALGIYRGVYEFDWAAAEKEFAEGLRLNPHSPVVRERYATFYLQAQLRMDEAVAHLCAALENDPLSPLLHAQLGHIYYLRRENAPALEQAQHALALEPGHVQALAVLVMVFVQEQRWAELQAFMAAAPADLMANPVALGGAGWTYALAGQPEAARQMLAALQVPRRFERVPSFSIAWVHHGLGERSQALAWLERAVEERDPKIVFLRTKPFWDGLREEPRFRRLLQKMALE